MASAPPRRRLALAASVAIIGGLAGGVYAIYRPALNDEHVTVGKRSGDPPLVHAEDKATAVASARTVEPQEAQGEKLALLINEFDKLMSEHRYAEAELVARRARELAPDEPVVKQMNLMVKMVIRTSNYDGRPMPRRRALSPACTTSIVGAIPSEDGKQFAIRFSKGLATVDKVPQGIGAQEFGTHSANGRSARRAADSLP